MSVRTTHRERGFALIGALFVLVVLAALGAFAVRINMTQQHGSTLQLQEMRTRAALHAGIEYAAARLLAPGGNCAQVQNIPGLPGNVAVTFANCIARPYNVNATTVTIYTLDVTATSGVYGTPEFVVRSARGVRVTT